MHSVVGLSEQDKCLRDDFKNWALIDIGKRLEDGVENGLLHEREAIEAHLEYLHTTMDNVLNTGHYSNVEERFRVFYAYVCALQAKFDFNQKKYDEALRCCDLGLLKGNDLENNFLGIFAKHLCTEHLSKPNPLNKIVFPTLPEPNSLSLSVPIAEIDDKKYFARFFKSKKPVILSKIVSDWLAINKWSFEYFNEQHGHRIVPVELGLKYTDDSWSQQLMTIHDYLDKYVYNEVFKGSSLCQKIVKKCACSCFTSSNKDTMQLRRPGTFALHWAGRQLPISHVAAGSRNFVLSHRKGNASFGRSSIIDKWALLRFIEFDSTQTTRKLVVDFHASKNTIARHLQKLGKNSRRDQTVPHELNERQKIRPIAIGCCTNSAMEDWIESSPVMRSGSCTTTEKPNSSGLAHVRAKCELLEPIHTKRRCCYGRCRVRSIESCFHTVALSTLRSIALK